MIRKFVGSLFKGAPAAGIVEPSYQEGVESEDAQTAASLDNLRTAIRRAGAELPPLVSSQLRQIDDLLRTVVAAVAAQNASTEQRVLLGAIISDYIPSPLRSFLAIPPADRTPDSRATALLVEQLATLEATIADLLNQIRIGAIAELSTHGRFLADKFSGPGAGLELGTPPRLDSP
ncbi:hypothetical protein [Arthrobacter sp. 35W]|uniref:hypothetical protein n=1 Tax=Arthrobacter sp. 35W TaxID=1132441 RepID=UPI000403DD14|nr:hypothetical protein [Arthrobacter sp. 35W]